VSQFVKEVSHIVDKIMKVMVITNNKQDICTSVSNIKTVLKIKPIVRVLNYYNTWMHELVNKRLKSTDLFCIVAKNPEIPIATANEYEFSKSLLIYHPAKILK